MKNPILKLLFFIFFFAVSCSNEKPTASLTHKFEHKVGYRLNRDFIYNIDSIKVAFMSANLEQKAEGRKMFMLGLELLINKSDALSSIEYFKEAICFYPNEESYSFLFKAYLKANKLNLADSTNNALNERIGEEETAFNSALIAAIKKDTLNCIEKLNAAFFFGFIIKDRIVNEPLFDFLKENKGYQSLMVSNFGNEVVFRKKLFAHYLNSLNEINLPFEVLIDSVGTFNYEKTLDYDYSSFIPGMVNTEFSRDVSNSYLAQGKIKLSNGYGVVYKMLNVIADTLNPVYTYLATYDSLGTIISNENISCFCSPLERKTCIIKADKSILVTSFKTEWEKDPIEFGYGSNKVVSQQELNKQSFYIDNKNTILEEQKQSIVNSKN